MAKVSVVHDSLVFAFPEIHPDAQLRLDFQRTLRIPDDDKVHSLPPGLGAFPLRNIDDYAERLPEMWAERGGVMLPMYQSEAMWISFLSGDYPFAIKVSTGGVCCLTAEVDRRGLGRKPQNYLVVPEQPWLDGYSTGKDQIRQFVAAPLNHEASVEKQIKGEATEGGMKIEVRPMTATAWEKRKVERPVITDLLYSPMRCASVEMGFAAGGKMRQEIYEDPYDAEDWSDAVASVNLWVCNSLAWRATTGEAPPTKPPEPEAYRRAGLPWFDYFDDQKTIDGSKKLAGLTSYLGGAESVNFSPEKIIEIRKRQGLAEYEIRQRGNN